ncbi:MAG: hypothetical protein HC828_18085 [Blastochloris sp.]|nr:hypothetical protein [Blastochloris sp.]
MTRNNIRVRSVLLLITLLVLTACGTTAPSQTALTDQSPFQEIAALPNNDNSAAVQLPPIDPSTVTGAIEIGGSSTVYLLTTSLAESFRAHGSQSQIAITSSGTTAGMQRFCTTDELDIVNASREIHAGETALCIEHGRYPIGFQVGTDALAVVVNRANTFVDSLSFAQLAQIFSGQATTWATLINATRVSRLRSTALAPIAAPLITSLKQSLAPTQHE